MRIWNWWKRLNRDYLGTANYGYGNWHDRLVTNLIYLVNVGAPLLVIVALVFALA